MPLAGAFNTKKTLTTSPHTDTRSTGTASKSGTATHHAVADSNMTIPLQIGDRVDLPKSKWFNCGTIRYRGPLKGVPHSHNKIFLGIELDTPKGKNNGSVGGFQMFECDDNCGVFCRPQIVRRACTEDDSSSVAAVATQRDQRSRPRRPLNHREPSDPRPTRTNSTPSSSSKPNPNSNLGKKCATPSPASSKSKSKLKTKSKTKSKSKLMKRKAAKNGNYSSTSINSHMHRGRRTFDPTLSKIPGVKGLQNLGNTCFVNSVLQNISNLPPVRDYYLQALLQHQLQQPGITTNQLTETCCGGNLSSEMRHFVRTMWLTKEPVLTPKNLFQELCKRVPRFGHRQQQDAVEALRYLFDGLDTEAMKEEQLQSKVVEQKKDDKRIDTSNNENMSTEENCSIEQTTIIQTSPLSPQPCGLAVAKTGLVAEIFSGILCSEISCDHCNHVSRVKERYSDLSLPIPSTLLPTPRKRTRGNPHNMDSSNSRRKTPPKMEEEHNVLIQTVAKATTSLPAVSSPTTVPPTEDVVEVDSEMIEDMLETTTAITLRTRSAPPTVHDESESGIETCMNHFFASEVLEGRDCDACETRSDAKRRYVLYDPLPKVLIIHVKRFAQTMTGRLKKLNTFVSYPVNLNVEKYCGDSSKSTSNADNNENNENNENYDPTHDYELSGVVVHGGTLHGGHYSAFVRHVRNEERENENEQEQEQSSSTTSTIKHAVDDEHNDGNNKQQQPVKEKVDWIYISDARVRIATREEALQRHGAYLLFYCRKDHATRAPSVIPAEILEKFTNMSTDDITKQLKQQTILPSEDHHNNRHVNSVKLKTRRDLAMQKTKLTMINNGGSALSARRDNENSTPPSPPTPSNHAGCGVQFPPVQTDIMASPALPPRPTVRSSAKKQLPGSLPRLGPVGRRSAAASAAATAASAAAASAPAALHVDKILQRREERQQAKAMSGNGEENKSNNSTATKSNPKTWLKLLKKKKPTPKPSSTSTVGRSSVL